MLEEHFNMTVIDTYHRAYSLLWRRLHSTFYGRPVHGGSTLQLTGLKNMLLSVGVCAWTGQRPTQYYAGGTNSLVYHKARVDISGHAL